ncbi:MAG TPA: lasso peptide biosynthesis B2 protein [Gaiellaceae bacterium]|nr:lasso peptide biosynthesis B2 protein [Gaiellaceae bacterium]
MIEAVSTADDRLAPAAKLRLALRIWVRYVAVRRIVRRVPLPEMVAELEPPRRKATPRHPPARLSRAVHRCLRLGGREATCLVRSLVLFRLLREQNDPAELVIGLAPRGSDPFAHAWVELNGHDVGPPPGRGRTAPLARFGGRHT